MIGPSITPQNITSLTQQSVSSGNTLQSGLDTFSEIEQAGRETGRWLLGGIAWTVSTAFSGAQKAYGMVNNYLSESRARNEAWIEAEGLYDWSFDDPEAMERPISVTEPTVSLTTEPEVIATPLFQPEQTGAPEKPEAARIEASITTETVQKAPVKEQSPKELSKVAQSRPSRIPRPKTNGKAKVREAPINHTPEQKKKGKTDHAFLTSIPKPHVIKKGTPGAQAMYEYVKHNRVVEFRSSDEKTKGQLPELSEGFKARNEALQQRKQARKTPPKPAANKSTGSYKQSGMERLAEPKYKMVKGEKRAICDYTQGEFISQIYEQRFMRQNFMKGRPLESRRNQKQTT